MVTKDVPEPFDEAADLKHILDLGIFSSHSSMNICFKRQGESE